MLRPTIPLHDLSVYLFGADQGWPAAEVGPWLATSPRFRAFAEAYRDKIRKKVRGLRDDESRRDLVFELAIALRLLADRRFEVEYESYGADVRAPDFRVTFRSRVRFNVEARRLRRSTPGPGAAAGRGPLIRAIVDKLGQLPPAMINVLILGADDDSSAAETLAPAMLWLQERAAKKEDELFVERGFAGSRDFLRHYQRLSCAVWLAGGSRGTLWRNPQARHVLPVDLMKALSAVVL